MFTPSLTSASNTLPPSACALENAPARQPDLLGRFLHGVAERNSAGCHVFGTEGKDFLVAM